MVNAVKRGDMQLQVQLQTYPGRPGSLMGRLDHRKGRGPLRSAFKNPGWVRLVRVAALTRFALLGRVNGRPMRKYDQPGRRNSFVGF